MSQDSRPAGRAQGRPVRALAAVLLSFGLAGLGAGCGFDAQTSQPYTPAEGTNLDVGQDNQLKIRNLVLVSRTEGQGFLSASIVSGPGDQMTGVSVLPEPLSSSAAPAPTAATLAAPVDLPGGVLVVLTDQPLITVDSVGLVAGGAAQVTMQFAQSGAVVMNCPVVDGTVSPWTTISPTPVSSPSLSPSPSPSPSATS